MELSAELSIREIELSCEMSCMKNLAPLRTLTPIRLQLSSDSTPNELSGRSRCAPKGVLRRVPEPPRKGPKKPKEDPCHLDHHTRNQRGFGPAMHSAVKRSNLRCMQRKLFKVVMRAGKIRGAWEEELRVGLS